MGEEILVLFLMSEETWNKVIRDVSPDEEMFVDEENTEAFIVAYKNKKSFDAAINRFNGEIEFKVMK